ncbi:hypothetical protein AURDEDRAFT_115278, partial [Auricularia subglabra TFB-10046 SS5]
DAPSVSFANSQKRALKPVPTVTLSESRGASRRRPVYAFSSATSRRRDRCRSRGRRRARGSARADVMVAEATRDNINAQACPE